MAENVFLAFLGIGLNILFFYGIWKLFQTIGRALNRRAKRFGSSAADRFRALEVETDAMPSPPISSSVIPVESVPTEARWPFYVKRPMTRTETFLYFRLAEALPDHIILAQVQLSRLLEVEKGYHFQTWFNRINRMSLDYVVCDSNSRVIAAIELDDRSHLRSDRIEADAKKDHALWSAGIEIIRWNVSDIPSVESIRSLLIGASE